jgi:iron complex transport system ATP-binding protein
MSLIIKDISLTIGDTPILKNISWTVRTGEHWAVFGLNGSGKTTLLKIINGYLWPSTGKVSVLGHPFGTVDLRELRKSIGTVGSYLQEQFYVNETVEEIVLSGLFASIGLYDKTKPEDQEKARETLRELNCIDLIRRPYKTLSQGEKQKVLIARALIASPRLLILDEPGAGLDVFAREQLLRMIGLIARNRRDLTMLLVTHYLEEIIPPFTKAVLLRKGEVHSCGETSTVFTAKNLSDFFNYPVKVNRNGGRFGLVFEPEASPAGVIR